MSRVLRTIVSAELSRVMVLGWCSGASGPPERRRSSLHLDDYLVLAFFTGSGAAIDRQTTGSDVLHSAGLIFLLVLFAVVVLLFTGRYPVGIFDLVLGPESVGSSRRGHAALMTDRHPPFSLDLGPSEPEVPTATQIAL